MIKVVKHGNQMPKDKEITTRCDECGCVFSFVDKDLYLGGDLCHSRELCEDYVCCLDCNNKIVVHRTSCFDDYDVILCEIVDGEIENEQ